LFSFQSWNFFRGLADDIQGDDICVMSRFRHFHLRRSIHDASKLA